MKRLFAVLLCLMLAVSLLPQQVFAATTIEKVTLSLAYPEAGKAPPEAAWYGKGYSVYDMEWHDWNDDRYLEPGDKIQAGHQYAVTIWVEADNGYAFKAANDNTPTVTATVNGTSSEVQKAYEYKAWAMITVSYYFESVPEKGWINSVDLTIPAPVTGAKPFYDEVSTDFYHLGNVYFSGNTDPKMKNGISWYNATNSQQLDPATGEVFAPETPYEFHCLVFPNEGYRITREARARVNGKSAKAMLDYATFLAVTYTFPATKAAHDHTPSGWRTTGAYHYKVCTSCGDFLEQEDHKGGVATCAEKGKCSVCDYEYIDTNENHTPDTSQWLDRGSLYHYHKCSVCGAHCDVEDHEPGPAGTPDAAVVCKDCGYVITPAKNHTHKLSKVEMIPATCLKEGVKEHYACSGCSDKFTDAEGKNKIPASEALELPALKHAQSDRWGHSETEHWILCDNCKEPLEETRKEHDLQDGKCALCGYAEKAGGDETPSTDNTPTDTIPDATAPQAPGKNENGMPWWVFLLIGVAAVAAGLGGGMLILAKKKKE